MAIPVIFDACGEDGDFQYMNGAIGGGIYNLLGNSFRTGFARCSIQVFSNDAFAIRLWPSGSQSSAWVSSRVQCNDGRYSSPHFMWGLIDAAGRLRIVLANPNTANNSTGPYNVLKLDAAGNQMLLGVTTSGFSSFPTIPDKLDVNFSYAAAGFLTIHINKSLVFSTGLNVDITTDGLTELSGIYLRSFESPSSWSAWSECIASDSDTRDMNVRTNVVNGIGTQDDWTGSVGNVDQLAVNDLNFDTTDTNGAIQRYAAGQITVGNEIILAKVTNLRATKGTGAISQIALAQLLAGGTHVSAPIPFPTSFGPAQFIEPINPATGVAWTFADLNAARETGYKAIA